MRAVRGNTRRATERGGPITSKMRRQFDDISFHISEIYDPLGVADWHSNRMEISLDPNEIIDKRKPEHRVPLDQV